MKLSFLSILVFMLAVLFSPVVFASDLGQRLDMPGYSPLMAMELSTIVAADCRDVCYAQKIPVQIYKSIKSPVSITENTLATSRKDEIVKNNHKGAAVLTDRTVYHGESQKMKSNMRNKKLAATLA